MTWQSDVLALVQLAFVLALVPTLLNRRARVPRASSLVTAAGLFAVATVYATLELWTAVAMAALSATAWTFIAVRRAVATVKPTWSGGRCTSTCAFDIHSTMVVACERREWWHRWAGDHGARLGRLGTTRSFRWDRRSGQPARMEALV